VQESPDEIANKISQMTKDIEFLQAKLDQKDGIIQEFQEETGHF